MTSLDAVGKIERAIAPGMQRERLAYTKVADWLRDLIVSGELEPGDRLPGELQLCELFQVSRSTIREAVRALASDHLVEVVRGAHGGIFVTTPRFDDVASSLGTLLKVMIGSNECSIEELVQVRVLLEVEAARIAADKRLEEPLSAMRGSLPERGGEADRSEEEAFKSNFDFHVALLEGTGNRAIVALAQPLYSALHTRIRRELAEPEAWLPIIEEHRSLLALIEAGDGSGAAAMMRSHLSTVQPFYVRMESKGRA